MATPEAKPLTTLEKVLVVAASAATGALVLYVAAKAVQRSRADRLLSQGAVGVRLVGMSDAVGLFQDTSRADAYSLALGSKRDAA